MKSKHVFVLMLFWLFMSTLFCHAERKAPTIPDCLVTPAELVSGQTYFIKNVETGLYMYAASSGSGISLSQNASRKILVTKQSNGAFTIRFVDLNSYLDSGSNDVYNYQTNYVSSYHYWDINGSAKSYTIEMSKQNSYYGRFTNHYVGHKKSAADHAVSQTCTDADDVHWQFFSYNEDVVHYEAECRLYGLLQRADTTLLKTQFEAEENVYTNRAKETTAVLNATSTALSNKFGMSAAYAVHSDYPIAFSTEEGSYGQSENYTWALTDNNTGFKREIRDVLPHKLKAVVTVDEKSELGYTLDNSNVNFNIYIDGKKVRFLESCTWDFPLRRYYETLMPGTHTIEWECKSWNDSWKTVIIRNIQVRKSPRITVSLLEPGSLGTEILYNVDRIQDVRNLKVIGTMNSDYWAKIRMMNNLQELDLSEAITKEVPESQFYCSGEGSNSQYLHIIKLPKTLEVIQKYAFYGTPIDSIAFPATLKTIRENAFTYSHIAEIILPDGCTNIPNDQRGYGVFSYMKNLTHVKLPKNLTYIQENMFKYCSMLQTVEFPERCVDIYSSAFRECIRLKLSAIPEGVVNIREYAFYRCSSIDSLTIPRTVNYIENHAFDGLSALKYLKFESSTANISMDGYVFRNCGNLKYVECSQNIYTLKDNSFSDSRPDTIRLNCGTVVSYNNSYRPFPDLSAVTLVVPNHLVNAYKLDKYWYTAKNIVGFDNTEVQDWLIRNNLVMNRERFGGKPNMLIGGVYRDTYLKINGEEKQAFNGVTFNGFNSDYNNYPGQILCKGNQVTVDGKVRVDLYTKEKRWYFFSLPFDCKISDIVSDASQYAIRYYDGANRAANGMSGSWKNWDKENDVIPAGTGFILQTNTNGWNRFYAVDNERKQLCVSNKEIVKTLNVNNAENKSNKGWNLVGNPWQCYYNNHCLNFTGPITVWNAYNRTYTAYSLTDDDYAIRPNEAFFVQCPNEEYNTIGFPVNGRQLSSVVETQNPQAVSKNATTMGSNRLIVNLSLTDGQLSDRTRIVINEKASTEYEAERDAGKFMSMDNSVPQVYTIGQDGVQYAINESPFENEMVQIGFYVSKPGDYTISIERCDANKLFLTDNETGVTTDITNGSYTYHAEAGTNNTRFTLSFKPSDTTTSVDGIDSTTNIGKSQYYTVDGRYMGTDKSKLGQGVYIVRNGNSTRKVIVR